MKTNIVLSLDMRRARLDGSYPIILRLSHKGKTTGHATGFAVAEKFWDTKGRKIKKGCPVFENVTRINNQIDRQRASAMDNITKLHDSGELQRLSITELKDRLFTKENRASFYKFTEELIATLKAQNNIGNARCYTDVLREVRNFTQRKDFTFQELTYAWLKRFEGWYLGAGNDINGLSFYMRSIRAIVNRAIKAKLMDKDAYPFQDYRIRSKPTLKRAISTEAIQRLAALDLKGDKALEEARNIFLFSFYSRGTPYFDLAFLKVSNLVDGRIEYARQKTGKHMSIKVSAMLQPILEYFKKGKENDDYLLNVVKRQRLEDQYKDVAWSRNRYNKRLAKLAELAGIHEKLTSYVSRHSFATAANNLEVPLTAISEMLGHQKISTTQVYLAGLKKEVLDDYSERIISG